MLNYEEGGERSCEDGDEHAETMLHEFGHVVSIELPDSTPTADSVQLAAEPGVRDPATESQFDYGSRAAIWRVMRSFKKHDIPITFYAVARAFERHPAVARYAEENGHEVASHCYKVSALDGVCMKLADVQSGKHIVACRMKRRRVTSGKRLKRSRLYLRLGRFRLA